MSVTDGHPFTTLEVTPEEQAAGALTGERLTLVAASLREHGAAIILGAVDCDCCDRLLP